MKDNNVNDNKFDETVTITLKEYLDLRDFKQNINDYYTLKVMKLRFGVKKLKYMSIDDAVIEISNLNRKLAKENNTLSDTNEKSRKELLSLKKDLAKMSVWQFIKWRHKV